MADNLLVVHGGGPTAVINASLYGVIREAKKNPSIGKVLGAIGGTGAIFTEQFLDLTAFSDEKLKLLLHTRWMLVNIFMKFVGITASALQVFRKRWIMILQ